MNRRGAENEKFVFLDDNHQTLASAVLLGQQGQIKSFRLIYAPNCDLQALSSFNVLSVNSSEFMACAAGFSKFAAMFWTLSRRSELTPVCVGICVSPWHFAPTYIRYTATAPVFRLSARISAAAALLCIASPRSRPVRSMKLPCPALSLPSLSSSKSFASFPKRRTCTPASSSICCPRRKQWFKKVFLNMTCTITLRRPTANPKEKVL